MAVIPIEDLKILSGENYLKIYRFGKTKQHTIFVQSAGFILIIGLLLVQINIVSI